MKQKTKWRPTKFNDTIVGKLVEAFKRDATIEEACAYAWINKDTFYEWIKKNKKFSDEIEQAKTFPHMFAKTKVFEALNSKDPAISAKYALEFLKRRSPDWKDKAENTNLNYSFTWITIEDATGKETDSSTDKETEGTSKEV